MMGRAALLAMLLALVTTATGADIDADATAERVASVIEREYVDAVLGAKIAAELRAQAKRGRFASAASDEALASELTEVIRGISGPGHLYVEQNEKLSAAPPNDAQGVDEAFEQAERDRYYGAHLNFGFEKVERLDGNIGLLELDVFAPVDMGGPTAVATMQFLASTDALIIDLRNNGGGYGEMANLLASYLFDAGTHPLSGIYSRERDATKPQHTHAYVPGPRYGQSKPVFILTSKRTFSAAEAFTYDLKALDRVTVVGARTGGGANPFEYRHVAKSLVLWLERERSVNPITKGNWQTVGITPDVEAAPEEAFAVAYDLAKRAVRKKAPDPGK